MIIGLNPIFELLKKDPSRIEKVLTCASDPQKRKQELLNLLSQKNISIRTVSRKELDHLAQGSVHQGFIAFVKKQKEHSLNSFLNTLQKKDSSIVLMLDSIYDPNNLGSILRASECFQVDGVILSKNRGCPITPSVSKVSAGASEMIPIIRVSNLSETSKHFIKEGFSVVAAACDENSTSLFDFSFPEKTLLILGSEGKGVQPLLLKKADASVYIPMFGSIDSLNVSQATSVFLSFFRKSRL